MEIHKYVFFPLGDITNNWHKFIQMIYIEFVIYRWKMQGWHLKFWKLWYNVSTDTKVYKIYDMDGDVIGFV